MLEWEMSCNLYGWETTHCCECSSHNGSKDPPSSGNGIISFSLWNCSAHGISVMLTGLATGMLHRQKRIPSTIKILLQFPDIVTHPVGYTVTVTVMYRLMAAAGQPPMGPYQVPMDQAYYYYGMRNPMDPNTGTYGKLSEKILLLCQLYSSSGVLIECQDILLYCCHSTNIEKCHIEFWSW